MTDREVGRGDLGKFRRDRGRRIGAGRAAERLARLFVGFALRQLSGGRALAEADFEEGPVLPGCMGSELSACKGTDDELENERIGSEPAERLPPASRYNARHPLHIHPTAGP